MLKAIETSYKGYRFRSRLEARWAVFFDALGVPYEYEKEGFDLGAAGRYLPDFWLPKQRTWLEIKPLGGWQYSPKCQALADGSGDRVVFVAGSPFVEFLDSGVRSEYRLAYYESGRCSGADPYLFALGRRDERELWVCAGDWSEAICLNPITDDTKPPVLGSPKMVSAYTAARRARFEFGERGR